MRSKHLVVVVSIRIAFDKIPKLSNFACTCI